MLLNMVDAEAVKGRINKRFEELHTVSAAGEARPWVCLVCDEFLKPREVNAISLEALKNAKSVLEPSTWNAVPPELAACYKYNGDYGNSNDVGWLEGLLLSPRACYLHRCDRRRKEGLSICSRCKHSLQRKEMPRYAIANNYCVGSPPPCLLVLTEVELAFLTPVKSHGYCFSYTGGKSKRLKGSLSYFKVKPESIARAAAHFDVLGLGKKIVVVLYGKMTPEQRAKAYSKNKMRAHEILTALQWLIEHNEEWSQLGINLSEVCDKLSRANPVLVDNSSEEEPDTDSNIETTESFKAYFPDGTMSSLSGGQENVERFRELVQKATENGFDMEFQCDLAKEAVADFRDNNLVNACLLQFPYGRGGMHELREKGDGSMTSSTDIEDYVQHLSKLSQPHYHHELFCLILYNLSAKQSMVRSAFWKARSKGNATAFSEELTADDVSRAINQRENGNRLNRNSPGGKFLSAIDAVSRAVPHTNEAAKRARGDGEALQHHFGQADVFLTVTPDDDNSFLVQVYAGVAIDDEQAVSSLSDEELRSRASERTELRIKHPGICAFFYEMMLEIILEEVIGWDLESNAPKAEGGLCGIPEAFTGSTEEQGRATLHTHFQIWIKGFREDARRLVLHKQT